MALISKQEGNVISGLAAQVELPKMIKVRQQMERSHIPVNDIEEVVKKELSKAGFRQRIHPGMSVAITCGSRGVANIAVITKAIVDFVKENEGLPFVFPAMGSHGGATVKGQKEILTSYGVTEEYLGCPIRATMEVLQVGKTDEQMPVYVDRYACEADAIILCGRIKAHTAFRGLYESGLMKMAVIGLGKQKGAETVHKNGFSELGRLLPKLGRVVLEKTPVIGGLGLIENAFDETSVIQALTKEEIYEKEPKLLQMAKSHMGKLYFDNLDVLVVDRIGKDINGDGMDPNIIGRYLVDHMPCEKNIQHIAVLDLTDETHGNCNGIGLADITTKRLIDKVDVDLTYPNVVTSTVLSAPKLPLFTHTDRECIQIALRTCNYIDRENPRIVRIKDTMHLDQIEISEAMLTEALLQEQVEILGEPENWAFNEMGNLW